jgi:hypothetical protein
MTTSDLGDVSDLSGPPASLRALSGCVLASRGRVALVSRHGKPMDVATTTAILTSLGVGGLLGSWVKTHHERSERFRERTIDASIEFLEKYNTARSELQTAERVVLKRASASDGEPTPLEAVERATKACRELERQAFVLSLVFRGGRDAPATKYSTAVGMIYWLWLQALRDCVTGDIDLVKTEYIAWTCAKHARAPYNLFVQHANDAIRPRWVETVRVRVRPTNGVDPEDDVEVLEEHLRSVRADTTGPETPRY